MTPTVLVLEDDDDMREMLVEVLEDHRYIVQGARQADEALDWSTRLPFHLAISDVRMAGRLDGLGAMEILCRRNPELACIVITGYASDSAPIRAARIRVDDYLYKPFHLSTMLNTVERVLNRAQERSRYTSLLQRLVSASQQRLESRRRDALSQRLTDLRERVLGAFYIIIRARDVRLTRSAARDLWDQLEDLDVQYQAIALHLDELSAPVLQALSDGYERLLAWLVQTAERPELGSLKARGPEYVQREAFNHFFEAIECGRIGPEQVQIAAAVRRVHPERREPDWLRLHAELWGC